MSDAEPPIQGQPGLSRVTKLSQRLSLISTTVRLNLSRGLRVSRPAPTPETVRDAGAKLIEGMEDGSVRDRSGRRYKPSTVRSYRASLEKHVYSELGARKVAGIDYRDLQAFVDRLARAGLDGSTIRNTVTR